MYQPHSIQLFLEDKNDKLCPSIAITGEAAIKFKIPLNYIPKENVRHYVESQGYSVVEPSALKEQEMEGAGLGLFATRNIKKGAVIAIHGGIIRYEDPDICISKYKQTLTSDGRSEKVLFIDGQTHLSFADLIQHSFYPNYENIGFFEYVADLSLPNTTIKLIPTSWGINIAIVIATNHIKKGELLTRDYGAGYVNRMIKNNVSIKIWNKYGQETAIFFYLYTQCFIDNLRKNIREKDYYNLCAELVFTHYSVLYHFNEEELSGLKAALSKLQISNLQQLLQDSNFQRCLDACLQNKKSLIKLIGEKYNKAFKLSCIYDYANYVNTSSQNTIHHPDNAFHHLTSVSSSNDDTFNWDKYYLEPAESINVTTKQKTAEDLSKKGIEMFKNKNFVKAILYWQSSLHWSKNIALQQRETIFYPLNLVFTSKDVFILYWNLANAYMKLAESDSKYQEKYEDAIYFFERCDQLSDLQDQAQQRKFPFTDQLTQDKRTLIKTRLNKCEEMLAIENKPASLEMNSN